MPKKPKCGFVVQELIDAGRITADELRALDEHLHNGDVKVPPLTSEQKALFLLSCDRQPEFTIRTIKEYYSARQSGVELFNERHLERNDLSHQLQVIRFSVFPRRTPEGAAILFHRLDDTTASHYHMEPSIKLLLMTLDAAVYDYPPTGLIILFDMKGVGLMHLTRVKLGAIKKLANYTQEGLPVKLIGIHVVNTQYFIDKVMSMLKPFLKKELYNQIHFHPPMTDYKEFHEKWIPKTCLPVDFGGDLPHTNELHEMNTKKLEEMRPYFNAEQNQRHDYYKNHKHAI